MRIAILTEFFHPDSGSGTGKVVSQLARKLHEAHGFEIDVFCSANPYREDSPAAPSEFEWRGVRVSRLVSPDLNRKSTPLRFYGNWMLMREVRRHLLRTRYDAVVVTTAPPAMPQAALDCQRLRGTPYAYIVYDLEPDRTVALGLTTRGGVPARILGSLQRAWLNGATKVVVIGRDMRRIVEERYGVPSERIELLEVGYPGPSVRTEAGGAAFREAHGLTGFLVAYSGNFARYHEFDTALEAAGRLAARGVDMTLLLIGGGHKKAYLQEKIARRGLTNVRMMPFVSNEEYEGLLQASDLSLVSLVPGVEGTCVPSKFYSLLAASRPTLAVMAVGAEVSRTILENGCGVVVLPGDAGAIVEAVVRLSGEPDVLAAMGHAAADAFDAKYDENRLVERWASMLSDMAR